MKVIKAGQRRGPAQLTCMAVGDSRAGKTRFIGTWPRPVILADASEHGYTTIDYMPPEFFYEPDRPPIIIPIEEPKDVITALSMIKKQGSGQPVNDPEWPLPAGQWEIGTVAIDSLTFYADMFFSQLEAQASGKTVDKRQFYGDLHSHLRYLMIEFHKLPYHVIWSALPKEGAEFGQAGGAMIAGQTATKAPARCDLWVHLAKAELRQGKDVAIRYDMHTQNYEGYKAGHRFGTLLDPVMDPEFRAIEEALGMEPWTARLAPDNASKKPPAKATTRATAQAQ